MKDGFYFFGNEDWQEYWQIKNGEPVCNFSKSKNQITYIENPNGYKLGNYVDFRLSKSIGITEAAYLSAKIAFINKIIIGAL